MPDLSYPQIDQHTDGKIFVLFALCRDEQVEALVLQRNGSYLSPLVWQGDLEVRMKRKSCLVIEAATSNLVVLDENWLFLGWQQGSEVWLGVSSPDMWIQGPPQHLVLLAPVQIMEIINTGAVQTSCPGLANSPSQGQVFHVPCWLGELVKKMGWINNYDRELAGSCPPAQ